MQNRIGHRFQRRVDVPVWLERAGALSYYQKVLSVAPANLIGYWPMDELAGGVAIDHSPEGNDGAYTGVALGQPGIGDGRTCPLFAGNDFNNVYSAGFNADFNGDEGALVIHGKVFDLATWTDGVSRRLWSFDGAAGNFIIVDKFGANQIRAQYRAGGVTETEQQAGLTTTDFWSFGMSWSAAGDFVDYYFNGATAGMARNTGLGVWAGPLLVGGTVLGAGNTGGALGWNGYLAHGQIWNIPLTAAQHAVLGVL